MAGPAPKTRNWIARENAHKPKGLHIIVGGEVEVSATNKSPELAEAPHVGKTLPLDLTIVDDSNEPLVEYRGKPVKVWKAATFHQVVSANQFERVSIRWNGKEIASTPVIDDREHGQHLAEITAAANEKAGKRSSAKPKKTTGEKVVKKAAEAVKEAVDTVTKAARKLVKKVTRTAPKKTAKKAAKKQTKKQPKKAARKSAARATARRGGKVARKAKAARRPARKAKRR